MFIEKLSLSDIVDYMDQHIFCVSATLNAMQDINQTQGKVSFTMRGYEFEATDFDFTGGIEMRFPYEGTAKESWIKFMLEKFGKEYYDAFFAHREEEKQQYINDLTERYDAVTKDYQEIFGKYCAKQNHNIVEDNYNEIKEDHNQIANNISQECEELNQEK